MKQIDAYIAIRHEAISNELRGEMQYVTGLSYELSDDLHEQWEYEVAYHEGHECTSYCTRILRSYLAHLMAEYIPVKLQMREEYEILAVAEDGRFPARTYVARTYQGQPPRSTSCRVLQTSGNEITYLYEIHEAIDKEIVVVPSSARKAMQAKHEQIAEAADSGHGLDWFHCPGCEEEDRIKRARVVNA